ncbi:unnamed protein product [Caenorhabditis auriculariae]|uniref:Uncharacterized protein n=1 Tax=Caenorhabditis auriculariae TaxID=2777116 RepID=A0A8S1H4Q0_9PELO|nr:unnamed protein product [Caenorhabditis auriculariae]
MLSDATARKPFQNEKRYDTLRPSTSSFEASQTDLECQAQKIEEIRGRKFCCKSASPKFVANMIVVLMLHEIVIGSTVPNLIYWLFLELDRSAAGCVSAYGSKGHKFDPRRDPTKDRSAAGCVSAYGSKGLKFDPRRDPTKGLVVATQSDDEWWRSAPWTVILVCRLLQLPAAAFALFGVYRNSASYLIPFMLSQAETPRNAFDELIDSMPRRCQAISLGSYADLHSYMHVVSRHRATKPSNIFFSSPLLFLVLPILIYALALIAFIYAMYQAIRFINIKRMGNDVKVVVDEVNDEFLL